VITVTGAESVLTEADLGLLKDGAVLLNAGHFPREIAVDRIAGSPKVTGCHEAADGITTFHLDDGRRFHLLAHGHMANLAGPRPLGNSIESMDLGFALQARCLEVIATGSLGEGNVVVPVPRFIDERVATSFLRVYGRTGVGGSASPYGAGAAGANRSGGLAADELARPDHAPGHGPGPGEDVLA
jgi:adenosylhomocysteinase